VPLAAERRRSVKVRVLVGPPFMPIVRIGCQVQVRLVAAAPTERECRWRPRSRPSSGSGASAGAPCCCCSARTRVQGGPPVRAGQADQGLRARGNGSARASPRCRCKWRWAPRKAASEFSLLSLACDAALPATSALRHRGRVHPMGGPRWEAPRPSLTRTAGGTSPAVEMGRAARDDRAGRGGEVEGPRTERAPWHATDEDR
jgi:hypothetical protein